MIKNDGDNSYFDYYSNLYNTENMLMDYRRTGTYHNAISGNSKDFHNAVVLDVGCGLSGILSIFAAKAGARKVYAVDNACKEILDQTLKKLIDSNGLADIITIIHGKIEQIELPEKVDFIISEPIGVLLLHERMVESFIIARNRFLKSDQEYYQSRNSNFQEKRIQTYEEFEDEAPTSPINILSDPCRFHPRVSRMLPEAGTIHLCPFSDSQLWSETVAKSYFWKRKNFYDVDLSSLSDYAKEHHFSKPVVGCFPKEFLAPCVVETTYVDNNCWKCRQGSSKAQEQKIDNHGVSSPCPGIQTCYSVFDFNCADLSSIQIFDIPIRFKLNCTTIIHGIAGWFDLNFTGSTNIITFSTGPHTEPTHWCQARFLLENPIAVNRGEILEGTMKFRANNQRSFNVELFLHVRDGERTTERRQSFLLNDQSYNYNHSTVFPTFY